MSVRLSVCMYAYTNMDIWGYIYIYMYAYMMYISISLYPNVYVHMYNIICMYISC